MKPRSCAITTMGVCCDEDLFIVFGRVQRVRCGKCCDAYFPSWAGLGRGAGIRPTAGMTQSGTPFSVPQWTSLRIRMDDTPTSEYSMEGDPFSATVMDAGDYQGARVYGTIQTIDTSGRFRGHTTMILVFNRLVMPDGRRAPISAEIVRLYHAPSGEFVDVEGAIESGGRGKNTFIHTGIGAGAGALANEPAIRQSHNWRFLIATWGLWNTAA